MNFEDIHTIEDLAVVSEAVVWQHFEQLAAFIFEKNGFRVKVNTVKTHQKTKRQYDVIAWKGNQTFLAECKKWAGNRYRLSALKKAVEQHKERTAVLCSCHKRGCDSPPRHAHRRGHTVL